eukprot:1199776-Prymnesium_polylepis.1
MAADGGPPTPFAGAERPAFSVGVGTVTELQLDGTLNMMHHIFHMHVQPFQLQAPPEDAVRAVAGAYFEEGDWHDTLRMPRASGGLAARFSRPKPTVRVRLQTDAFTGTVVMHCHYLTHQDQGMMATFAVRGAEGTPYAPAPTLEPRGCYRTRHVREPVAAAAPAGLQSAPRADGGVAGVGVAGVVALLLALLLAAAVGVALATRARRRMSEDRHTGPSRRTTMLL